jgi:TM2 domain-containing membrane protein YozV
MTKESRSESVTQTLSKIAGIFGIVAGALSLIVFVLTIFDGWWIFASGNLFGLSFLVGVGLVIAGGVLALRRNLVLAPWLLIAAWVVFVPVRFRLDEIGEFSIWNAYNPEWAWIYFSNWASYKLIQLLTWVALWLMLAAVVVALVAFFRTPADQRNPRTSIPSAGQAASVTGVGMATVNDDGTVSEGWYADPDGKPSERYWDGNEWTDKTRPRTAATAALAMATTKPTVTPSGEPISSKSRAAAAILAWFLGFLGIHRFYLGKVGTGILMIVTLGGLGVWWLIDLIWILVGTFKDKDGNVVANW